MNFQGSLEQDAFGAARDGVVAGLIATAPMTAAMTAIHRQLPYWERARRLPPEQITMSMADKVDVNDDLDHGQKKLLTLVSHFGYGAMSGAAYGVFAERTKLPPVLSGASFGLAVWAVSYLGWLPAAQVRRSAVKEPAGTNFMMIASHVVWGVSTAIAYQSMRKQK